MNAAALVIGLCSHGLSVARGLHQGNVDVYALEKNRSLPGTTTGAVKQVFAVRDFSEEVMIAALLALRPQFAHYDEMVLFPTNDNHVRILGSAFARLAGHYRLSWSDCIPQVLRLQKKDELEAVSVDRGLNYPRSAVIDQLGTAAAATANFRFPVIIKPVQPLSSFKTILTQSAAELAAALFANRRDLPILAQEYVSGGDESRFFGTLLLDRGRTVQAMAGRKRASFPPALGQTTIAEAVYAPEVIALTEQFFRGFAMSGPVSLELKKGADGSFWLIEPTVGRTDFWCELCIAAGFNQSHQEFQVALGQVPSATAPRHDLVGYNTERAMLAYWQAAWRQRSLQPFGKRAAFTFWRRGDMAPFWRASAAALRRTVRRLAIGTRADGTGTGRAVCGPLLTRQFPIGTPLPAQLTGWLGAHAPHPIFSSPEWCEQLVDFKRTAQEPLAVREFVWLVAYEGDTPLLAAALEINREKWGQCRLALLSNYYTPLVGVFADPAVLDAASAWRCLLQTVDQQYPGWLTFGAAPLAAAAFAHLQAAAAGHSSRSFPRHVSVNQIAPITSLAAYWQARPSQLRNTVKRKQKLLAKAEHRFELVREPSAAQVEAYWEVYRQSWKPQEPSHSFIDWLMAWNAQRGSLRLGLLYVDAQPVACQMWLVEANRAYIVKLAQTSTADQYSPGTLLTGMMVDALCEPEQLTHIDFLLGSDPFKKMWMDEENEVSGVELVNQRTLAGKLLATAYRVRAAVRARRERLAPPAPASAGKDED